MTSSWPAYLDAVEAGAVAARAALAAGAVPEPADLVVPDGPPPALLQERVVALALVVEDLAAATTRRRDEIGAQLRDLARASGSLRGQHGSAVGSQLDVVG